MVNQEVLTQHIHELSGSFEVLTPPDDSQPYDMYQQPGHLFTSTDWIYPGTECTLSFNHHHLGKTAFWLQIPQYLRLCELETHHSRRRRSCSDLCERSDLGASTPITLPL